MGRYMSDFFVLFYLFCWLLYYVNFNYFIIFGFFLYFYMIFLFNKYFQRIVICLVLRVYQEYNKNFGYIEDIFIAGNYVSMKVTYVEYKIKSYMLKNWGKLKQGVYVCIISLGK